MSELVTTEYAGHVATVTMRRWPANALDQELQGLLEQVALSLATADEVRVVVLRSDVDRIFAGGADIGMIGDSWANIDELMLSFKRMCTAWAALPIPVVAAIQGHAVGGGCELAMCCDFRVMVRGRPRIGLPEVKLGVLASGGGTQRLTRLVGQGRALDLTLRGRLVDADEAAAMGLVTVSVDRTEFEDAVDSLVAELAAMPPLAVAAAKRCIVGSGDVTLEEGFVMEMREMAALARTNDAREGVAAFLDKRSPRFLGR